MDNKIINFFKENTDNELSKLSIERKTVIKNRVMQAIQANSEQFPVSSAGASRWRNGWHKLSSSIFVKGYVLAPLVVVIMLISTTAVSANALPGDLLYPVKRQVESARLLLAPSNEAKLELELNFAEERLKELDNIRSVGPVVSVQQGEDDSIKQTNSKNSHNSMSGTRVDNENSEDNKSRSRNRGSGSAVDQQSEQEHDSDKEDREDKARKEAEKALEFMEKAKEKYREDKAEQRAEDLNKKIEDYRKKIEKDLEHNLEIKFERNSGSGKGDRRDWDNKIDDKIKERLFD